MTGFFEPLVIGPPNAVLQDKEFCSELLRTLADALKLGGGNFSAAVREPGDFNGPNEERLRRRDGSTASAEGFIDISAPLEGRELESRAEYTRVHFRASLTVTVIERNGGGDAGAEDRTEDAGCN